MGECVCVFCVIGEEGVCCVVNENGDGEFSFGQVNEPFKYCSFNMI